jgi:hypothetical protein
MLKGKGLVTPIQSAIIKLFASLPDKEQLFLAGGTALAEYYLGHRISRDVDIFTGVDGLVLPLSHQVEMTAPEFDLNVSVLRRMNTFVQFLFTLGNDTLKVDLAMDSPYHLFPPDISPEGLPVSSYPDLASDKLLAFFGREEPRDAVDLYFILKRTPLSEILKQAKEKDTGFDLYYFAVALARCESYPDAADRWPVNMVIPWNPVEIKNSFHDLSIKIMQQINESGPNMKPDNK